MRNKAQASIFIIVGILIVVAVFLIYFLVKPQKNVSDIPSEIEPIYSYLSNCIETSVFSGVDILETQGGYISLPEFEPGSGHYPFSNQLDFLGNPVAYWFYVSGNGLKDEQIPSKGEMEQELAEFVKDKVNFCDFQEFYDEGYNIEREEPRVSIDIRDEEIRVNLDMDFTISKGDVIYSVNSHDLTVDSNLGKLYVQAKEVYNTEMEEMFLEEYSLDVLRNYAPVTGVELDCMPKYWKADDVFADLRNGMESNIRSLNFKKDEYFDIEGLSENVQFVNSKDWPYTYEVNPSDESLLIAEPVGNQEGLGVLGFCYIPYHFVYNLRFPVLVRVYSDYEGEFFQFGMPVLIEGNNPREPLGGTAVSQDVPDVCEYRNTPYEVEVYDSGLNFVDASVSFECLGVKCDIGETQGGILKGVFPQCVNGNLIVKSEGYRDASQTISTVSSGRIPILLEKEYELDVELNLDGRYSEENAMIVFERGGDSETIVYPDQKKIMLSEGQYSISVYVYKNSSLRIGESVEEKCFDVPRGMVGGFFGFTKEKCVEINVPAQMISNVLSGGGFQEHYILEQELKDSQVIEILADSLQTPRTLDELQENYIIFEEKNLEVNLK